MWYISHKSSLKRFKEYKQGEKVKGGYIILRTQEEGEKCKQYLKGGGGDQEEAR